MAGWEISNLMGGYIFQNGSIFPASHAQFSGDGTNRKQTFLDPEIIFLFAEVLIYWWVVVIFGVQNKS